MSDTIESIVKARKRHSCFWCMNSIIPGETYLRAFVVDGGDCWTVKSHLFCQEVANALIDFRDDLADRSAFGAAIQEAQENGDPWAEAFAAWQDTRGHKPWEIARAGK